MVVQVTVTWEAIGAVGGLMALIARYAVWAIKDVVRTENAQQLKDINGTYTRSGQSRLTGAQIEQTLQDHKSQIQEVEDYAHHSRHEWANEATKLRGEMHERHHKSCMDITRIEGELARLGGRSERNTERLDRNERKESYE